MAIDLDELDRQQTASVPIDLDALDKQSTASVPIDLDALDSQASTTPPPNFYAPSNAGALDFVKDVGAVLKEVPGVIADYTPLGGGGFMGAAKRQEQEAQNPNTAGGLGVTDAMMAVQPFVPVQSPVDTAPAANQGGTAATLLSKGVTRYYKPVSEIMLGGAAARGAVGATKAGAKFLKDAPRAASAIGGVGAGIAGALGQASRILAQEGELEGKDAPSIAVAGATAGIPYGAMGAVHQLANTAIQQGARPLMARGAETLADVAMSVPAGLMMTKAEYDRLGVPADQRGEGYWTAAALNAAIPLAVGAAGAAAARGQVLPDPTLTAPVDAAPTASPSPVLQRIRARNAGAPPSGEAPTRLDVATDRARIIEETADLAPKPPGEPVPQAADPRKPIALLPPPDPADVLVGPIREVSNMSAPDQVRLLRMDQEAVIDRAQMLELQGKNDQAMKLFARAQTLQERIDAAQGAIAGADADLARQAGLQSLQEVDARPVQQRFPTIAERLGLNRQQTPAPAGEIITPISNRITDAEMAARLQHPYPEGLGEPGVGRLQRAMEGLPPVSVRRVQMSRDAAVSPEQAEATALQAARNQPPAEGNMIQNAMEAAKRRAAMGLPPSQSDTGLGSIRVQSMPDAEPLVFMRQETPSAKTPATEAPAATPEAQSSVLDRIRQRSQQTATPKQESQPQPQAQSGTRRLTPAQVELAETEALIERLRADPKTIPSQLSFFEKRASALNTMIQRGETEGFTLRTNGRLLISEEMYQRAVARQEQRIQGGQLFSNPLEAVGDAVIYAAYHFENGVRDFAQLSKQVVAKFGEDIRPHMARIWEEATGTKPPTTPDGGGTGSVLDRVRARGAGASAAAPASSPGYIGSVNERLYGSPEEVASYREFAERHPEIESHRKVGFSQEQMMERAGKYDFTDEQVRNWPKNGELGEKTLALKARMKGLRKQWEADGSNATLQRLIENADAVNTQLSALGRDLKAQDQPWYTAESDMTPKDKAFVAMQKLQKDWGIKIPDKIWDKFRTAGEEDMTALNHAITDATASVQGLKGSLASYMYNNMLSAWETHAQNLAGSVSNIVETLPVRTIQSIISPEVSIKEVPHYYIGAAHGIPEGFKNFAYYLAHGFARSDSDVLRPGRVEMPGGGRNFMNWPSRVLGATDELSGQVAFHANRAALASRRAAKVIREEGLKGDAAKARYKQVMADEIANPHSETTTLAMEEMQRTLYRQKMGKPLEDLNRNVQEPLGPELGALKGLPNLPLMMTSPFVRIPMNWAKKNFLDFTPLGVVRLAKPANWTSADKRSRIMAEAALGSIITLGLAAWMPDDWMTGHLPVESGERSNFFGAGMKPNSVNIGGRWVDKKFLPFAGAMIIADALKDAMRKNGIQGLLNIDPETAMDAMGFVGKAGTDQTFLAGWSGLIQFLSNPGERGESFGANLASMFIPLSGAQRSINRATDPYIREAQSISERILRGTVAGRWLLPPKETEFGQTIPNRGTFPPVDAGDPVSKEFLRLGLNPPNIPDVAEVGGQRLPLTQEEKGQLRATQGNAYQRILARIQSPDYKNLPMEQQKRLLEVLRNEIGGPVKSAVLQRIKNQRRAAGTALDR